MEKRKQKKEVVINTVKQKISPCRVWKGINENKKLDYLIKPRIPNFYQEILHIFTHTHVPQIEQFYLIV